MYIMRVYENAFICRCMKLDVIKLLYFIHFIKLNLLCSASIDHFWWKTDMCGKIYVHVDVYIMCIYMYAYV